MSLHRTLRVIGVLVVLERRRHRLTPMGEHFVRRARAISSELRRAREEIEQLRGDTRGIISVSMSSVPHLALLPYAIRPFRERFPDIHIDVLEGVFPMFESGLRDGTIDCYVGPLRGQPETEDLVVEKLFDINRVILGRKNHPLAKARSLRDLVGAEWVSTSITRKLEDELAPLFEQYGLPAPHIVMQAHSALTSIVSVTNSDLLTLLPDQWMDFSITRMSVQAIPVSETLPTVPLVIVRRAGLPLTPAAEYFCDMLRRGVGHMQRPRAKRKQPVGRCQDQPRWCVRAGPVLTPAARRFAPVRRSPRRKSSSSPVS